MTRTAAARTNGVARLAAVFAATALAIGCRGILDIEDWTPRGLDDAGASVECTLSSDCSGIEICLFERCSPQCAGDKDCAVGARCLVTSEGLGCVESARATCAEGCPEGSVCAGDVCRNACDADADCLDGQVCSDGACLGTDTTRDPGQNRGGSGGTGGDGGSGGGAGTGGVGGVGAGGVDAGPLACADGTYDHDDDPTTGCRPWSSCGPGQYVSNEGTPTSDRTCSACASGMFSATDNAEICTTWRICQPGERLEAAGTATSDAVCVPCSPGTFSTETNAATCESCPEGTYSDEGDLTACSPWTVCNWFEVEQAPPTAASDTVCSPGSEYRQFGTSVDDGGAAVAVDANENVYVSGQTNGVLDTANAGGSDAFVRKYDANGRVLWTRQFGTSGDDNAEALAIDGGGNVYVAGMTRGDLAGTLGGIEDAYVRKYDPSGTVVWTRQFGTDDTDSVRAIAVDGSNNIVVVGSTSGVLDTANIGSVDAFARKYDPAGDVGWTRQFGTGDIDHATGVGIDGGGEVYVVGWTQGSLGAPISGLVEVFVRRYSDAGVSQWTRQFGSATLDFAYDAAVDANNNLLVAAGTSGDLETTNAGGDDAVVRKYAPSSTVVWTVQRGTTETEWTQAVASNSGGNVYAGVYSNAGSSVQRFDAAGTFEWSLDVADATIQDLAASKTDIVYAVGYTQASLNGPNAGGSDVFLMRVQAP